jgi:DNA-binding response OmpR family regulator
MPFGRIIVDPQRRWLAVRGLLLELGQSEAAIAAVLAERSATLDELAAVLAEGGRDMDQQGVKNVLQRLRRKLEVVGLAVVSAGYGQGWRMTAAPG